MSTKVETRAFTDDVDLFADAAEERREVFVKQKSIDYTRMPHDGHVYLLITGGELLDRAYELVQERRRKIAQLSAYMQEMSEFFKVPIVGTYGCFGYIHSLVGEIPVKNPKPKAKDLEDRLAVCRAAWQRVSDRVEKRFATLKKLEPWKIDSIDRKSSPMVKHDPSEERGLYDANTVYVRFHFKPAQNRKGGKAVRKQLDDLRIPELHSLGREMATASYRRGVIRGTRKDGAVLTAYPALSVAGDHYILSLPISGRQPKNISLTAGKARRLTHSEYWRLVERECEE